LPLGNFFGCDVMTVTTNQSTGLHEWHKRQECRVVSNDEILQVFPRKPGPYAVTEARRALRHKQRTVEGEVKAS
jgi:hypothetical protein